MACGQYKDKEEKNNQKSIEGPENVNFQFFEKCFFQFFSFCPKDLAYQKSRFHNKKCGLRHCRKNCPKLESPKLARARPTGNGEWANANMKVLEMNTLL